MNIFEVWLDAWTMTDLYIFGGAGLLVVLVVAVRAIRESRANRT